MNISLNFKPRFVPDVESGKKRQTIRLQGKRMAVRGDTLYLFTGLRTKRCRRLVTVVCTFAEDFTIDTLNNQINTTAWPITLNDQMKIILADGFDSRKDFFAFFRTQYGEGIHNVRIYRW